MTGSHATIDRRKNYDDEFDCEDYSDECMNYELLSVEQMVKKTYWKICFYSVSARIIVFNFIVIIQNLHELRSLQNNHSTKHYN